MLVGKSPLFKLVRVHGVIALERSIFRWHRGSIDFIAHGMRVVVTGRYGGAKLEAIAESIIKQMKSQSG